MILHIPHNSTIIPSEYLHEYSNPELSIDIMTDHFVSELFEHWNTERVEFKYSRLFCDVERLINDPMEEKGQGIVYTKDVFGSLLRTPSDKTKEDVAEYYLNHHKELNLKTRKHLVLFPEMFVVDCHSFYPYSLTNDIDETEEYQDYPDFCIGTNKNTPQQIVDDVMEFINERGYSVKLNFPFSNAIVPSNFQNDERVHSIMIEVNKKLYLTKSSRYTEKSDSWNNTKDTIHEILDIISKYEILLDK